MKNRRWDAVAALAVALLLVSGGATAAFASWRAQVAAAASSVQTADFGVTATWTQPLSTSSLLPGQSTEGTLHVVHTGGGNTLGWRLLIDGGVPSASASSLQFTAFVGTCSSGTAIASSGYPVTGNLVAGQAVDVCVRYSVPVSAPNAAQGQQITPQVTVTAAQAL